MLSSGPKYELDALANKDFLTKTYLPRKFKERDWPDETVRLTPGL